MKTFFTAVVFFFFVQKAFSQVSGKITDPAGLPVPFAGISVLESKDSILIKDALTDKNGVFTIEPGIQGDFILRISSIGYKRLISEAFKLTDSIHNVDLGTLVLQPDTKQLGEVIIRADKPLVQQEASGLVVNVQSSILTKGSSVLQVLQRSPGVIINPIDNTISLNGKSGVMVMLDGKLMRMSMTQIATFLNGMSADNIEKIELLNTPPAKYDADGNAGLINIVTKKNKRPGTDGSFTATAGYGKGEKASTAISVNHNTEKISLHGSYSFSHERSYGELLAAGTESVPAIGGQTSFNYSGIGKPVYNYHDVLTGVDARLNKRTSVGGNINYSVGYDDNNTHNYGAYALRPDSVLLFNSYLAGNGRSQNMISSFFLENEISKGEKINIDADYIFYKNTGNTEVQSTFADNHGNQAGTGDSLYSPRQRDLANTTIKVGVAKLDYTKQINTKLKLEGGVKGTYTRSSSFSGIENLVNGNWALSGVGISNNLGTKEIMGAAYATLNVQVDTCTNIVIGERYEYSRNSTDRASDPIYAIDRKLGKLFPNIFFSRRLDDQSGLQLSYTERIGRPSYRDLVSYVTYNDPISVFTGNPALKPTITHNLKLGYGNHDYLFSLLYSKDDNPIIQTQIMTGPSKGLVYLMPENASWQNSVTLQATIPCKINDWWGMNYGFVGGFMQYKVDYTPMPFVKTWFGYSVNFTETYKLPKSFSFEVSGYYNSSSYYGTSRINGNVIVNSGIKKDLPGNDGSFQLSISDLLRSSGYNGYIGSLTKDAFSSKAHVSYNGESTSFPIIKLTYYRSFGSAGIKNPKKVDNGSKEERDRL